MGSRVIPKKQYLSSLFTHSTFKDCVIHAFLLFAHVMQRLCILTFLKHRGLHALPITNGVSKSPNILTYNITVNLSLEILPAENFSLLRAKVLLGRTLKNNPLSPQIFLKEMLKRDWNYCNHPFEAWKFEMFNFLLTSTAFNCRSGPDTGTFLVRTAQNQSYRMSCSLQRFPLHVL